MVGLNNLGNTCYLNSVLQCLIATNSLVVYLFDDVFIEECRNTFIKKKDNLDETISSQNLHTNSEKRLLSQKSMIPQESSAFDETISNKNDITIRLKSFVCIHLYEIMKYAYNNDNQKTISPSQFYKLMGKKHDIFNGNDQNDSHEILNFILHDIIDEVKTNTNFLDDIQISKSFKKFIETKNDFEKIFKYFNDIKTTSKTHSESINNIFKNYPHLSTCLENINETKKIYSHYIKNNNYFVIMYNSHVYLKKFFHNNYSPIHKIFSGLYCFSTTCLHCDKSVFLYEPFLSISLPIKNDENETSLNYCLDNFLKGEYLSNNNKYKCNECKEYSNAHKKIYILKKPDVLVFHLKRFFHVNKKISKNKNIVHFPIENLIIKNTLFEEYMDADIDDENVVLFYNLYAIICHLGTIDSGHYISFCKNIQNGKWYSYDDDNVEEIDIETLQKNIVMKTVFLLFYQNNL